MLSQETDVGQPASRSQFDGPLLLGALANQKKHGFGQRCLQFFRRSDQRFEPVRHAHGPDVADQEAIVDLHSFSKLARRRVRMEKIRLRTVLDD